MQTQTSNTLHNAIMEAGGKDRPPMLAPGNYVQWKSKIKRYIDTKPNHELIYYCLKNPPYKYQWADKDISVAAGSTETTTERTQQAATRNRGKPIVNSPPPIYDQEPSMKLKRAKDAAYHKEKMLLYMQEEAGFQLNAEQADLRDDTDDESKDQKLEAHYMYMAQIQEVNPDAADNSRPIFDSEPLQKDDDDDDDLANERDLLASLIEK
nr:hypothetical protein [Tanacetum cinerariifolium]